MGRRKKETFYQLLKRRIREHGEAAFEAAQQAKKQPEPTSNAQNCKNYREHHPEKVKAAEKNWFENFKKEHGMCYTTYYYRKKHGLL